MDPQHTKSYLKLGQFLDLESRWAGTADSAELAHRICRTVEILLVTPTVAIGALRADGSYALLASQGRGFLTGGGAHVFAQGGRLRTKLDYLGPTWKLGRLT